MDLLKNRVITKTDWIIIGLSMFALVIALFGGLLIIGMMGGSIDNINTRIADAQTKLSETRVIAAKKEGLLNDLQQVRQRIASFEGRLPTEKEIPKLLNQFQKIAEDSGVMYRSITAEPIEEKDLFVRIPFKVEVEGAYPQIGEFLRSLEFGARFIKVDRIDIGPEENARNEANFTISTYMFVNADVLSQSGGA